MMNFYSKLCLGQSPGKPSPLKDAVTKNNLPWVNDTMNNILSNVVTDTDKRTQLLSLMGPAGCHLCQHLLLDQGEGKLIFPHLQWTKPEKYLPQHQSTPNPHVWSCPMIFHLSLAGRRKLTSKIKKNCQTCLSPPKYCGCNKNKQKPAFICPKCPFHVMLCDHSEAVTAFDTYKEMYRSEYHRLAKKVFPTGSSVPELGMTNNLVSQ